MDRLKRAASGIAFLTLAGLLLPACWLSRTAPVPSNAASSSEHLTALACPSAAFCVATGTYFEPPPNITPSQVFIDTLSNNAWTASTPSLPSDADGQLGRLDAVACVSVASCVAVGTYETGFNMQLPLVETLSGGRWTPSAAPLPPGVSAPGEATLTHVSCASDGTCVAIGIYGAIGSGQPMIDTLSGGSWTSVIPPVPSGYTSVSPPTLDSVSCASASTCIVAAGSFEDSLSAGSWTAGMFPLPTGGLNVYIPSVSCVASGFCVASGIYGGANEDIGGPVFETLSGGTWSGTLPPIPGDATGIVAITVIVGSAVCVSANSCVAMGQYQNAAHQDVPFSELYASGSWTTMSVPMPSNAASGQLTLSPPSCASGPTCTAVGSYYTAGYPDPKAFFASLSGGTWTSVEAPVPVAFSDLESSSFSAVSCATALICFAVGDYGATSSGGPIIDTESNLGIPQASSAALSSPSSS